MKTTIKILASIFVMMSLFFSNNLQAQFQTVKTGASNTELMRIKNQSDQNYIGLGSATFTIQAMVEKRKTGNKYNILLRTQNISMEAQSNYSYIYKPGFSMKNCVYDELKEYKVYNFSSLDIGAHAFELLQRTATATFEFELLIWVKDKNYRNDGYRTVHVIKDVKANGVFWSDKEVEGDFDVSEVKIIAKKILSFQADESAVLPAIEAYVKRINDKSEADCKKADNKKEEENLKKQEEEATTTKETNKLKAKLSANTKPDSKNKIAADDFWSGREEKSTIANDDGNHNNVEAVKDETTRRLYLKDVNGNIIKEWSIDVYYHIKKLGDNSSYFQLIRNREGTGYQSLNNNIISDKKGNTVRIDGEESFKGIQSNKQGGYDLSVVKSESLYNDKLFLGQRSSNFQNDYSTSTEAISDLKQYIEKAKDKQRKESKGQILIGWDTKYNVIQVKKIVVNSKMQVLTTKTTYQIE